MSFIPAALRSRNHVSGELDANPRWLTSGLRPTSSPTSGSSKRCFGAIHVPWRSAATPFPAWSIVDRRQRWPR